MHIQTLQITPNLPRHFKICASQKLLFSTEFKKILRRNLNRTDSNNQIGRLTTLLVTLQIAICIP